MKVVGYKPVFNLGLRLLVFKENYFVLFVSSSGKKSGESSIMLNSTRRSLNCQVGYYNMVVSSLVKRIMVFMYSHYFLRSMHCGTE